MKKTGLLIVMMVMTGLFFTSCEKEYLNIPGNSETPIHKDGEAGSDDDITDDEDDEDDIDGITDGGRDEDYDKSGRKKPKPN